MIFSFEKEPSQTWMANRNIKTKCKSNALHWLNCKYVHFRLLKKLFLKNIFARKVSLKVCLSFHRKFRTLLWSLVNNFMIFFLTSHRNWIFFLSSLPFWIMTRIFQLVLNYLMLSYSTCLNWAIFVIFLIKGLRILLWHIRICSKKSYIQ